MGLLSDIFNWFIPNSTRGRPVGITDNTLRAISESAENSHPNEFLCFLTGEDVSEFSHVKYDKGKVITDFYIIPGTKTGPTSAKVKNSNIPVNSGIIGSLHTHPNGTTRPSDEDLQMFASHPVNIIMTTPYSLESWQAYSSTGDPLPNFPIVEEV